ncbi:unnamed protein product [Vitrella brassicaformis CCMP3155]|uniref:Uncharacterized protein n=1 Tax=Vitrella brassicaformis (strain CCMP3155) TaxID=1169540 RepID=A0A0G4EA14_VITBC|nr:unnamed protein product [Vitrella brassicaformis CCMP3155]|eukprot:CEL92042.1 unnamed protein product [Vitrella brassicaformis CCMP3155]
MAALWHPCHDIQFVYLRDSVTDIGVCSLVRVVVVGFSHPPPTRSGCVCLSVCSFVWLGFVAFGWVDYINVEHPVIDPHSQPHLGTPTYHSWTSASTYDMATTTKVSA